MLIGEVYATQLAMPNVPVVANGVQPAGSDEGNFAFFNLGDGQVGFNAGSGTGGTFSFQSLTYGSQTLTPMQAQTRVIAACQAKLKFYDPIVLKTRWCIPQDANQRGPG